MDILNLKDKVTVTLTYQGEKDYVKYFASMQLSLPVYPTEDKKITLELGQIIRIFHSSCLWDRDTPFKDLHKAI